MRADYRGVTLVRHALGDVAHRGAQQRIGGIMKGASSRSLGVQFGGSFALVAVLSAVLAVLSVGRGGATAIIAFSIAALAVLGLLRTVRVLRDLKRARNRLAAISTDVNERLKVGLEALAAGNLTFELDVKTEPPVYRFPSDEIGDVMCTTEQLRDTIVLGCAAYNKTTENLRGLIAQMSSTAATVGTASQEMSSTSEESGRTTGEIANAVGAIAQGAERQVQIVEHAKCAADEVALAVSEAATNAHETSAVAYEARGVAEQGLGAADQANEAMRSVRDSSAEVSEAINGLAAKSDQIGQIVQTITAIAEQTNLLALNAAIEAARAGEQGRGFAVVAEEVRKLAEEAQRSAEEISALIDAIQTETGRTVKVVENGAKRTQDGAAVVEQTREAFVAIGSSVEAITGRIDQIAVAAELTLASTQTMQDSMSELTAVAEQSSASTQQVSASTEETSASAEEIAASAHELSSNAQSLSRLVAQFKLER